MSTPVLASNSQRRHSDNETKVIRRTACYHPSVWGDYFINCAPEDTEDEVKMEQQLQQLKEEVLRKRFVPAADNPSQMLNLIDTIQCLGVSYHFGSVIETALRHIYETCPYQDDKVKDDDDDDDDLHTVALKFRLLRQQGFPVSSDMFNKFKDGNGKFRESLTRDVRGMLSLYEASHLRVHGEDLLDEALDFTRTHLESPLPNYLRNPLGAQVIHALKQPIRTGLNRLEARSFISLYEEYDCHDEVLLILAKLDFNLLQKMHQRELGQITMWWKDLDFSNKLPFVRDRIVECYFWILGVYFEPQYLLARTILTKVISMTSIIDDIYDASGIFEELVLFTDSIERWDINAMDQLPEYMKLCYQALLDVYSMIEEEMAKEGKSYCIQYAKAAMKELVRAYFDEAKWLHRGYVPTMEEYMDVALVSCGYRMLATTSFVGMGKLATKEAFECVSNDPLIVKASSVINRLMDDMVSRKFEQKRGHVVSAVECYMKQHGTSEKETLVEFQKQVTNAWKDINEECLQPTEVVPMPLLERVLNLARVINLLYKDGDGYTHSRTKTKNFITSVVVDYLPLSVC